MSGSVSIVGAGPGDPGLLTLKAWALLQEADVVLVDALVPDEIVRLAPRARVVSVGKRAGRRSVRQEVIHRLLIRLARRGLRIVRLKGGDPFVLGRGGEEALALSDAGIPFEVVPGISSSIAAAALAGIPVTHRGIASGFVVVSGHSAATFGPILDPIAPHSATIVVLMGLATRGALSEFLIERGWRPWTPAAILFSASTPEASRWTGALQELGAAPVPEGDPPGTIVIGDVVSIGTTLEQRTSHVLHR